MAEINFNSSNDCIMTRPRPGVHRYLVLGSIFQRLAHIRGIKIYFGHIYLSTFLNLTAHFDLYFFEGAPFHLDLEVVYILILL